MGSSMRVDVERRRGRSNEGVQASPTLSSATRLTTGGRHALESEADRAATFVASRPPRSDAEPAARVLPAIDAPAAFGLGGGAPLPAQAQASLQSGFGFDFRHVRVHTDGRAASLAARMHADAFTTGSHIGFAAGRYAPGTAAGQWLLAHEAAHAIQQSQGGRTSPDGAPPLQLHSHQSHRHTTIEGTRDLFSPEQVAALVVGNWERDLSQCGPEIVNLLNHWDRLKAESATGTLSHAAKTEFLFSYTALMSKLDGYLGANSVRSGTSLGGYRWWEHVDRPGYDIERDAAERWSAADNPSLGRPASDPTPGYLLDMRAYIKDCIIEAVNAYRRSQHSGELRPTVNPWTDSSGREVRRPDGYGVALPDSGTVHDREGVRKFALIEASKRKGRAEFGTDDTSFAPALSRANHAIQDFFSHSNFIEHIIGDSGGPAPQVPFTLARFELDDQLHTLSEKIIGMIDELSRSESQHLLAKVFAINPTSAPEANVVKDDHPAWDARRILKRVQDMMYGGPTAAASHLGSPRHLASLRAQAEEMGRKAKQHASKIGHANVAKDIDHKDGLFELSETLAIEATYRIDRLAAQAMTAAHPDSATGILAAALLNVDGLLSLPRADHPFVPIIQKWWKAHRPAKTGS